MVTGNVCFLRKRSATWPHQCQRPSGEDEGGKKEGEAKEKVRKVKIRKASHERTTEGIASTYTNYHSALLSCAAFTSSAAACDWLSASLPLLCPSHATAP